MLLSRSWPLLYSHHILIKPELQRSSLSLSLSSLKYSALKWTEAPHAANVCILKYKRVLQVPFRPTTEAQSACTTVSVDFTIKAVYTCCSYCLPWNQWQWAEWEGGTVVDDPLVNHIPRGSRFMRKWCRLQSGSDPPSACLLGLFRNTYRFRSKPHCYTRLWRTFIETTMKSVCWFRFSTKATQKNVCVLTCQINHTRVLSEDKDK